MMNKKKKKKKAGRIEDISSRDLFAVTEGRARNETGWPEVYLNMELKRRIVAARARARRGVKP